MKSFKCLLAVTLVTIASQNIVHANEADAIKSITVIMSNEYEIAISDEDKNKLSSDGMTLSIFNLDAVSKLENEISQLLPADEEQAQASIQAYINKIGQDQFNQRFKDAYQAHIFAIQHGIKHIPAFVFNEKSVVYGEQTLDAAIQQYQASLKRINGSTDGVE